VGQKRAQHAKLPFSCTFEIINNLNSKLQKMQLNFSSHIFRRQLNFAGFFLRVHLREIRSLIRIRSSLGDTVDEKPIFLVGQHDIAIIQDGNVLNNDKGRIQDQSIQYKLRDKVLYPFHYLIYILKESCCFI
jgi:hypothetical protein